MKSGWPISCTCGKWRCENCICCLVPWVEENSQSISDCGLKPAAGSSLPYAACASALLIAKFNTFGFANQ
jgi:hypothetical protein